MKLTAHPLAELPLSEAQATALDQQLILRLRVSLAELLSQGDRLAVTFHELLFARDPGLRRMFPIDLRHPRSELLETLAWIVLHLDRRDELLPAVRALGRRYASYGALQAHYPLVFETLIHAMRQVAGDAWNDQLTEDWSISLDLIASHMRSAISTTPR